MFTRIKKPKTMKLTKLMAKYQDGDEEGWDACFEWIREYHVDHMIDLREDIATHGIVFPILLGNDGRVWDGHHRILVALEQGIKRVPVRHA